jgi:hypothetical protein
VTVKASVGFFNFFNNRRFYALFKKGVQNQRKKERKKASKKKKRKEWHGMEWKPGFRVYNLGTT